MDVDTNSVVDSNRISVFFEHMAACFTEEIAPLNTGDVLQLAARNSLEAI